MGRRNPDCDESEWMGSPLVTTPDQINALCAQIHAFKLISLAGGITYDAVPAGTS